MTTISPNRRQRGIGPTILLLGVCVVCLAGVVWLRPHISNLFWKVFTPVMQVRTALGSGEATQLRAELASSTALIADRNALYRENIALKQLLGRTVAKHTVLGAVLMRPPGTPYDTLIIDVGKQSGVAAGNLVFAGGTAAIGTVSDVYDTTARVTLLSAPGESYQALLSGSIPFSLTGQGAGSMSGEVPAGTVVAAGDSVSLPGVASSFVGSVSYVRQESGASFISLYVQLPVNLFSLPYVEVQTQP